MLFVGKKKSQQKSYLIYKDETFFSVTFGARHMHHTCKSFGTMSIRPRPMCPRTKGLGRFVPWTMRTMSLDEPFQGGLGGGRGGAYNVT
jgi:hypothetical protein